MIVFNNWQITNTGDLLARQYDNLSRTLLVKGVPEGYDWKMMVQVGGNFDILTLAPMEDGVGIVLTKDQLSISGYYTMQLVGTLQADGVTTRHTNVLQVFIPSSLSGDANWPTVPSEFSQIESNIKELNEHPSIPGENGFWLVWDLETHAYAESEFPLPESGTPDHTKLSNRDAADQHPMSAITGLEKALDGKQPIGDYLTDQDIDTTLKEAGKAADASAVGSRLSSLSEEIVTTAASQVSAHNAGTDTHSDIRLLISGLTDRLNALADSDDTTMDQLSEIVAYIKSNRSLIEAITTSKVSVADIVDNLTANVANKPLSAAQGVVIKTLIDSLRNDKLDAAELTNAVNTALAQAKASGEFDGADGQPGADGVGIQSVEQTTTSTEDGGTNIVTVTKTDGTTSAFTVRNGSKGSTGPAGADGYTPQRGIDYWTAADQQAIVDDVLAALPSGDEVSY